MYFIEHMNMYGERENVKQGEYGGSKLCLVPKSGRQKVWSGQPAEIDAVGQRDPCRVPDKTGSQAPRHGR